MTRFEDDLKKQKNPWIKRIGNYLLSRDDLKETLNKENKSLRECFDYILIELAKDCVREGKTGFAAGDDEEIFSLAVHYYDEDEVKVGKKNFTTNADESADAKRLNKTSISAKDKEEAKVVVDQEAIDKAVADALDKYRREEKEKEKQKKEEAKKKIEEKKAKKVFAKQNKDQMNLFDMLGDF